MPLWFELVVLMLVGYAIGLGLGWMRWGTSRPVEEPDTKDTT